MVISQQERFDVQDDNKSNSLKCDVDLVQNDFELKYSSDRSIALFTNGESQVHMGDDGSSLYRAHLTIKIPKEDVKARRFDNLKVVQGSITYLMRPKTGDTRPAPVEFI